jgi:hypothetical protein
LQVTALSALRQRAAWTASERCVDGHDGKGGVVLSKLTKLTITRGDGAVVLRGAMTMG